MKKLVKNILALIPFCILFLGCHHHAPDVNNSQADAREKLFQRFVKEMTSNMQESGVQGYFTNRDVAFTNSLRRIFDQVVIDPSFGLKWDEVPGPTMKGSNDMASVDAFVRSNGWRMETNDLLFDDSLGLVNIKPIRGLP